jgi:hypothetical protein
MLVNIPLPWGGGDSVNAVSPPPPSRGALCPCNLLSPTCKHAALQVPSVGWQFCYHPPQVAPVGSQHVGVHHVGVTSEVGGVGKHHVEPLAHEVLHLPQKAVHGLDLLSLGKVPVFSSGRGESAHEGAGDGGGGGGGGESAPHRTSAHRALHLPQERIHGLIFLCFWQVSTYSTFTTTCPSPPRDLPLWQLS